MTGWRSRPGARPAAVVAVLLLGAGLVLARPDVAVLGLPTGAVALLALRRPAGSGSLDARVVGRDGGDLLVEVAVVPAPGAEQVVLGLGAHGEAERPVVLAASPERRLRVRVPVLHSGPQTVLAVRGALIGPSAGSVLELAPAAASTAVAPVPVALPAVPLPASMTPRPGSHRAPRAGEGDEFRDLAPFVPGDRLRRIDWRTTARQADEGALIVRRTDASAEAAAVVLLDSRVDVGAVVAEWATNRPARKGPSTLDAARAAAVSLAAAYLDRGDRVAFHDLARFGHGVRSGGGRRQRDLVTALVAAVAPTDSRGLLLPPLPPSSVVLLLSAFLDDEPVRIAELVRATGLRTVAVDVLPPMRTEGLERRQRVAARIVGLEREARLTALAGTGVDVVPWADGRDAALLAAARPRRRR